MNDENELSRAKAAFRELLRAHGIDPDATGPLSHDGQSWLDVMIYGNHYDEVDPKTGERRCIPADRVVITHQPEVGGE